MFSHWTSRLLWSLQPALLRFREFDRDGNGSISVHEVREAMEALGDEVPGPRESGQLLEGPAEKDRYCPGSRVRCSSFRRLAGQI